LHILNDALVINRVHFDAINCKLFADFVFEKKIVKRIFGPTKENQIWEIKTNEELDALLKDKNVVSYVKAQRLSWFSYVQTMPYSRTVKKIFKWNPLTKRSQGNPKFRWEDDVKQNICQINPALIP